MNQNHYDLAEKVVNGRFRNIEINGRKLISNRKLNLKQQCNKTTAIVYLYSGDHEDNKFMQQLYKNDEIIKFLTYNAAPERKTTKEISFNCRIKGVEIVSDLDNLELTAYYLEKVK